MLLWDCLDIIFCREKADLARFSLNLLLGGLLTPLSVDFSPVEFQERLIPIISCQAISIHLVVMFGQLMISFTVNSHHPRHTHTHTMAPHEDLPKLYNVVAADLALLDNKEGKETLSSVLLPSCK